MINPRVPLRVRHGGVLSGGLFRFTGATAGGAEPSGNVTNPGAFAGASASDGW
jgi:hypothetical protein